MRGRAMTLLYRTDSVVSCQLKFDSLKAGLGDWPRSDESNGQR